MRSAYRSVDAGKLWSSRLLLNPKMHMLGDHKDALTPSTFVNEVRARFFRLHTDLGVVEEKFVAAMNRGSDTLNSLVREHSPNDEEALRVGNFHDIRIPELLEEARRRYRLLKATGMSDIGERRKLYEILRGLELGHQILRIDTEKEVQLSLRFYSELIDWFHKFLGIGQATPCPVESFGYTFQTDSSISIYGNEGRPFRSRVKCLTPEGEIKYGSLLIKAYLALLEDTPEKKIKGPRDYTGVEFIVGTDTEVEQLVDYFRATAITGRLEDFKQRQRAAGIKDNHSASSEFGITKFIFRVPIGVDEISGHPLGDQLTQLLQVEVQILSLEDHHIRDTHQDARHANYKKRQFDRISPAIFPMKIYRQFLRRQDEPYPSDLI